MPRIAKVVCVTALAACAFTGVYSLGFTAGRKTAGDPQREAINQCRESSNRLTGAYRMLQVEYNALEKRRAGE